MSHGVSVADTVLGGLQEAVAAKDLNAVMELLDEDVVLFGGAAENLDRTQTRSYLERVLAQPGTLRWEWRQVVPLWEGSDVVAFAVVGTVGFDDDLGQPVDGRDDFRLTCVAVRQDDAWRLRHFHGSGRVTG